MSNGAKSALGFGVALLLALVVPLALGQQNPPSDSPGYVDVEEGECFSHDHLDYCGAGDSKTPEDALNKVALKGQTAEGFVRREAVPGEHVVFEKYENGKIIEAYDAVKINGLWALQDSKKKVSCPK